MAGSQRARLHQRAARQENAAEDQIREARGHDMDHSEAPERQANSRFNWPWRRIGDGRSSDPQMSSDDRPRRKVRAEERRGYRRTARAAKYRRGSAGSGHRAEEP